MPPPPYGQYPPGPPGYPPYPAPPPARNGLAIASLVCAFLFFPLGIVLGHLSLSRNRGNRTSGDGLAIAGLVVGYAIATLTAIAVIVTVGLGALGIAMDADAGRSNSAAPDTAVPRTTTPLPAFAPPAGLGANCQYPASTEPASKSVNPPRTGRVPTTPATVDATIDTAAGAVGLTLANGMSPCTVNNFVSLAQQGFYDATRCHRLTTSSTLRVLQCGDPTGLGTGGPGYRFPNEYPTNQYRLADPGLEAPVVYPRGTLAMANGGPGTNGSQFFVVYGDSQLPPTYTVFGTVDETGLAVVDAIARAGVKDGSDDGAPATDATITSVRLD
ncbi:cyclophilin [Mycolicibacterium madagascariense]|uniref:Cyclophilin n=1 Tax=Mycolicibacterium madagascariense TaxID=212765 RepID=A0A7I7XGB0_9MYCO|nr:peptidylprolyl isomerase [Mycolicibacterium madagascariense]MCV7014541.1 peptidylprolyl isomerase [Mycolicibacterium madagascariense]BBZ28203.1 cyclophilin [Mycolicibacterium madagascariense]